MRRRLTFVAVTTASLALALAGCGNGNTNSGSGGTAASAAPQSSATSAAAESGTNGDAVEWANGFCEPIGTFSQNIKTKSQALPSGDPKTALTRVADFFEEVSTGAGTVVSDLNKLGPAPAGGEEVKSKVVETFGTMQESFKTTAQKARSGDAAAVQQAMTDFSAKMEGLAEPFSNAKVSPELKKAMQDAPKCKELNMG